MTNSLQQGEGVGAAREERVGLGGKRGRGQGQDRDQEEEKTNKKGRKPRLMKKPAGSFESLHTPVGQKRKGITEQETSSEKVLQPQDSSDNNNKKASKPQEPKAKRAPRSSQPGASSGGEGAKSKKGEREKATFARRAMPNSDYGQKKWVALRGVYACDIAPYLNSPSYFEDRWDIGVLGAFWGGHLLHSMEQAP